MPSTRPRDATTRQPRKHECDDCNIYHWSAQYVCAGNVDQVCVADVVTGSFLCTIAVPTEGVDHNRRTASQYSLQTRRTSLARLKVHSVVVPRYTQHPRIQKARSFPNPSLSFQDSVVSSYHSVAEHRKNLPGGLCPNPICLSSHSHQETHYSKPLSYLFRMRGSG